MSEWQPIDTAPKDGKPILTYWPNKYENQRQHVAYWTGWGGGVWESGAAKGEGFDGPSHWMPLPAPPKLQPKSD